jgi:site-specific recombinase XerC
MGRSRRAIALRQVTLKVMAIAVVRQLLGSRRFAEDDFLFWSQQGQLLQVPTVTNMVKRWCVEAGLSGEIFISFISLVAFVLFENYSVKSCAKI